MPPIQPKPRIWVISGSDNTGGAGLQKDLLTICDLGASAATIVSCVTSQNQNGISHITSTELESLFSQIDALMALETPAAIKVGMLGSIEQVDILSAMFRILKHQSPELKIVLDPVCYASAGGVTNGISIQQLLPLMKLCDLVTPNIPEANELLQIDIRNLKQAKSAGAGLFEVLNSDPGNHITTSVVLKGGHLENRGYATDILVLDDPQEILCIQSEVISTSYNHGTGCLFSSAITAAIAQDFEQEDAIVIAKAYLNQGLKSSYSLSAPSLGDVHYGTTGHKGWPDNPDFMPRLVGTRLDDDLGFLPVNKHDFRFYPVVDTVEWIEKLLSWGVKTLQLRIKDPDDQIQLEKDIRRAIELGRQYQAQLFINDHWKLAIKHHAYGVHLGQEDMEVANLLAIKKAGLRLGISTHGYMELLKAILIQPSYIALGHIFATQTKDMPSSPQGPDRLAKYQRWAETIAPTVAIGGIKLHNLDSILRSGVDSVAVVTAVTNAADPQQAVQDFIEKIDAHLYQ